jgi:protein dithiol oxidoreductase (disulfide-forming)
MKRRDFSLQLAAAGLGTLWAGAAAAQGGPVEGTHYSKLAQPVAVSAPAGKIEVLEFFSYGCPHCYTLEPTLEAWAKRQPADVVFKRVPVGFNALYENYQKIFYALESMGQAEHMHRKVFDAIHQQRQRLDKEADIAAFMSANGLDGAKFIEVYKSFSVQTKARQAQQLSQSYKIDGVPAMAVQGRYVTSGSMAGSNERALAVTDALVQGLRKPT